MVLFLLFYCKLGTNMQSSWNFEIIEKIWLLCVASQTSAISIIWVIPSDWGQWITSFLLFTLIDLHFFLFISTKINIKISLFCSTLGARSNKYQQYHFFKLLSVTIRKTLPFYSKFVLFRSQVIIMFLCFIGWKVFLVILLNFYRIFLLYWFL